MAVQKRFFYIDDQCVHLRQAGAGAPVVLLHASPSSSKLLLPLMAALSERYCVLAIDLPGYGLSQPLAEDFREVADYANFLHRLFMRLGLKRFALYGTATGAQIAIRYAILFPEQVVQLYLDNAAHFTDGQRSKILEHYFPDLQAKADGSHLAQTWTIVRRLFTHFPWCFPTPDHRLQTPCPPPPVLHQVALDFFQAGRDYDRAYKAAFLHEHVENVRQLRVATTIFDWMGSIIRPYILQLLDFELPEQIKVERVAAARSERYEKMREYVFSSYQENIHYQLPEHTSDLRSGQNYLCTDWGDLHLICHLTNNAESPVVLIHEIRSSAATAFRKYQKIHPEEPSVIALSLPGHGDSDDSEDVFPTDADALKVLLKRDNIRLHRWEVATPLPKLIADDAGAYLFKAWHFLQDRYLYADPERKGVVAVLPKALLPEPEDLQLELREWLKCRV